MKITKNWKDLDKSLYTWDENTRTFSSSEDWLVLDFSDMDWVTFDTGYDCTFNTGYKCTFKTGSDCTFNTGYDCTFNTGYDCTFNTDSGCTFNTGYDCTFKTGFRCTFNTGYDCTFKTGSNCVIVRRDLFEVIILDWTNKIKLNWYKIKGYTIIEDSKKVTVELTKEQLEKIKHLI